MEDKMKKKIILFPTLGFVLGAVIGFLIALTGTLAQGGKILMELSPLAEKVGLAGAIALQIGLSGVLGCVSFSGMLLYEIDSWSLALATGTHYLSIMGTFATISYGLGWFGSSWIGYAIAAACNTVAFAIIWFIMYYAWKKTVREMNDELKKYKEETQREKTEKEI